MIKYSQDPLPYDERLAQKIAGEFGLSQAWIKKVRKTGLIPRRYFVDEQQPVPAHMQETENRLLALLASEPGLSNQMLSKLYCRYPTKLNQILSYRRTGVAGREYLYATELDAILKHLDKLTNKVEQATADCAVYGAGSEKVQLQIAAIAQDPAIILKKWLGLTNSEVMQLVRRAKPAKRRPKVDSPITASYTLTKFTDGLYRLWSELFDLTSLAKPN